MPKNSLKKTITSISLVLFTLQSFCFAESEGARQGNYKVVAEDESAAIMLGGKHYQTVSDEVATRSNVFTRRIFNISDDVFVATEYAGASVMVLGEEGAVIVGALLTREDAQTVAGHFEKFSNGKIVDAIVLPDALPDSYGGIKAFVDAKDLVSDDVKIIAHNQFMHTVKKASSVSDVVMQRTVYMMGGYLEKGVEGLLHFGATAAKSGHTDFIQPNYLVGNSWAGEFSGLKIEIHSLPAESDEGIITYFPDKRLLVVGHAIIGDFLPQVYTPRGQVRDPKRWYKSLEWLLEFVENHDVDVMIPMHFFEPIMGKEKIRDLLQVNRDALQFMADQSDRMINEGATPDDFSSVKLPDNLANHPHLGEHYGVLSQHMIQRFYDQLGWFEGDPTFIDKAPKNIRANKYIAEMGGRQQMLKSARNAISAGDYLWGAEILTWLIESNINDMEARNLKASAMRELGYLARNAYHRNWYLTSALELEGKLPTKISQNSIILPKEIVENLSVLEVLEFMKTRLVAEKVDGEQLKILLHLKDTEENATLIIRNGVLVTKLSITDNPDLKVTIEKSVLRDLVFGNQTFSSALKKGQLELISGSVDDFKKLDEIFEKPGDLPVISLPFIE